MPSNILIKRSSTASAIPTAQQLLTGELAINLADKKLYTNNNGSIIELGTLPSSLSVSGDTALTGSLDVTGATTLTDGSVSGDFTVVGTLTVSTHTSGTDAASKAYVDTSVSNVIDSSPALLNTLNELAAAINDDADFATTITNSIATKVNKAGDTLTGDLVMGGNKITSTATPVTDDTLTRKGYVDTILGSATAAATSATNSATSATSSANSASSASTSAATATTKASEASTSATNAASSASAASTSASSSSTSATASATSATASATSAANAESAWDSFDDVYLGAKATPPTVDNDGFSLLEGTLYWNTVTDIMYVRNSSAWVSVKDLPIAVEAQTKTDFFALAEKRIRDNAGSGSVFLGGVVSV